MECCNELNITAETGGIQLNHPYVIGQSPHSPNVHQWAYIWLIDWLMYLYFIILDFYFVVPLVFKIEICTEWKRILATKVYINVTKYFNSLLLSPLLFLLYIWVNKPYIMLILLCFFYPIYIYILFEYILPPQPGRALLNSPLC